MVEGIQRHAHRPDRGHALSARSPECVANWHAARRAVERRGANLTVHLGDITLDGQVHSDELAFAARLMQQWHTEVRCMPGNHDLGDGSGERATGCARWRTERCSSAVYIAP